MGNRASHLSITCAFDKIKYTITITMIISRRCEYGICLVRTLGIVKYRDECNSFHEIGFSFDLIKKSVLHIHNISQFAPSTNRYETCGICIDCVCMWHVRRVCVYVCASSRARLFANRFQYNLSSTYSVHIQRESQRKWRSTATATATKAHWMY